jgi:hypothetical protein
MSDSIDRRTILTATLAWAAATLSGCSDNGDKGGATCPTGDAGGGFSCGNTMTGDHKHPLTICGADVAAGLNTGLDKTFTLENGGTGHTHMYTLTAYDCSYLNAGATIMRDSTTTNNHLHTISITCTPA